MRSVLKTPEAPGWRARRFKSAIQTVCFIVMLGRTLSPCRGLAAQIASPTLGLRPARVGLTLVCRPGMGSLDALPGAGTPMRCGAVPSSSPLSLSPPAFSDEACSSSDSLADVLLQRFTQDVQLNQLPLRIPAELLDTESEPPAVFDLWEYLSQGLPPTDFGQVVVLYLPLLNLAIFILVLLAFPRSLGHGMRDGGQDEN